MCDLQDIERQLSELKGMIYAQQVMMNSMLSVLPEQMLNAVKIAFDEARYAARIGILATDMRGDLSTAYECATEYLSSLLNHPGETTDDSRTGFNEIPPVAL